MIIKFQNSVSEIVQQVIEQFPMQNWNQIFQKEDIDEVEKQLNLDLMFFVANNPATKGSKSFVLSSFRTFLSVVAYRIGNRLIGIYYATGNELYRICAMQISEWSKKETGVEIDPRAKIGCPFVIDHGYGTVIGETAEIGRYCYILQGVILGAKGIMGNPDEKRHPTIGDNVHLGAFVQVLGNISIGNNAIVGPGIKVTQSIPSHSTLIRHTEYYILRRASEINFFTL